MLDQKQDIVIEYPLFSYNDSVCSDKFQAVPKHNVSEEMAQSYYMLSTYINKHFMHTFSALLAMIYNNLIY